MATKLEFTVTGEQKIHCAGCEQRIGRALGNLPGVRAVTASAATQKVEVKLSPSGASPERVRAKLEELGYQTEEQESYHDDTSGTAGG